ncbi:MAG: hypothetical protein ABEJ08_00895 [Halobacteriaceae archaeon]
MGAAARGVTDLTVWAIATGFCVDKTFFGRIRRFWSELGKSIYATGTYWVYRLPAGTPMPTCDHCEAHVSERFARVFGDENGAVKACPNCSANAGIAEVSLTRAHERS